MLTDRLEIIQDESSDDTADIFEQSLFTIFSDSRNQHGEPGQSVVYKSEKHGDIRLCLADPHPSENSLFSHFLWNASKAQSYIPIANSYGQAGLQAAEMITAEEFDVKDSRVLELGAGAGNMG